LKFYLDVIIVQKVYLHLIFLVFVLNGNKHVGAVSDYHDLEPDESSAISIEDVQTSAVMELHINVGYVSFIVETLVVYSLSYKIHLVVVLKAVSKIKKFSTSALAFVSAESANLKNNIYFFLSSCCRFFLKNSRCFH
jgi:hypothetical protein